MTPQKGLPNRQDMEERDAQKANPTRCIMLIKLGCRGESPLKEGAYRAMFSSLVLVL